MVWAILGSVLPPTSTITTATTTTTNVQPRCLSPDPALRKLPKQKQCPTSLADLGHNTMRAAWPQTMSNPRGCRRAQNYSSYRTPNNVQPRCLISVQPYASYLTQTQCNANGRYKIRVLDFRFLIRVLDWVVVCCGGFLVSLATPNLVKLYGGWAL